VIFDGSMLAKADAAREKIRTFSLKDAIQRIPNKINYEIKKFKQGIREASSPGKLLMVVGVSGCTAIALGSIAGMIINALHDYPDYVTYFLHTLELYISLSMIYMLFEAVIKENEFQLTVFLLQGFVLVIRASIHLYTPIAALMSKPDTGGLLIVGMIASSFLQAFLAIALFIAVIILSIRVYRSFGWKVFRYVGSNRHLIASYRLYAIYAAMNKFDVLIVIGVLITNSFFLYFEEPYSYVGFVFLFFFSIITPSLSVNIAVKKEFLSLQIVYLLWSLALPGFLLYRVCCTVVFTDCL
jgi:hypothetical protein